MEQTITMKFEVFLENEEIREWVANVLEIHYGNPLVFRGNGENKFDPAISTVDPMAIEVLGEVEELITENNSLTESEKAVVSSDAQDLLSLIFSDGFKIPLHEEIEQSRFITREFVKLCGSTAIISSNYALLETPFSESLGEHNWIEDCLAYFASEFYGKKVTRDDTDTIDKFTTEEDYTFFFSSEGLNMKLT